ncbi:MAG: PepSY-like domain-containing protein, partial [Bacteroidales bacterium]|nr:PepSY-like domain-containing protein [Bacteroidales bacterium]
KGLWTSIECRGSALPAAVVPAQILDYVKKNYPDTEIRKIDKEDRGGYEVELSNNMELKFNSSYKLVDIDM